MATTTAGALIVAGLRRADMLDSPTGFIRHAASGGGEAFDYLNSAISELFDILYEAASESYASAKPSFNTANNQADYAILTVAGSTFYHLMGIDYFDGARHIALDRVNLANRNDYPIAGSPRGYAIEGDNITIYPTPNSVYAMRIRYEALPPTTSADADVLDIKGPWSEFVQIHFAIQCLEKEESDTTTMQRRLYGPSLDGNGGLAQRIRAAAKKRDSGQPTGPIDVHDRDEAPPYARWTR